MGIVTNYLHKLITKQIFICSIEGEIPYQLSSIKIPAKPATRDACIQLAKTWRLRRDLKQSYITHANSIEAELGLNNIDFQQQQITNIETFLAVERTLQRFIETTLLTEANTQVGEIVKYRSNRLIDKWR